MTDELDGRSAGGRPGENADEPADVVILIALEEELLQLLALLAEPPRPRRDSEHGGYEYRFVAGPATAPYRCAAALLGSKGPGHAALVAERMIAHHAPAVVVSVGLAAGVHRDVRLTTVVIAEHVDAYLAESKAVADGHGGWTFERRGAVFPCDHALLQHAGNFHVAHAAAFAAWSARCRDHAARELAADEFTELVAAGLVDGQPRVVRGHLASGPVVAAAAAFCDWLRARDASIVALEMESAGPASAAWARVAPVPVLVVRGISDLGDERKGGHDAAGHGAIRRLAMGNASRFLLALLDAGLLPRRARATVAPAVPPSVAAPPGIVATVNDDAEVNIIGSIQARDGTSLVLGGGGRRRP